MNIAALASELATGHPVTGAYSANDVTATEQLNALNRTRERASLTSGEIYNALDPTEFSGLSAALKELVRDILGLGGVSIASGTNARAVLLQAFGAGTTTRTNLVAVVNEPISRAQELGLGEVKEGHVWMARGRQ